MSGPAAIVIGGGVHGLSAAIELARAGASVRVLERGESVFSGASRSTFNRAHSGYHYPRSRETARECLEGLEFLRERYPASLVEPARAYYLLAKEGSRTQPEEFERFCEGMKLCLRKRWPGDGIASRETLAASYLVREPCYDASFIAETMQKEARQLGVSVNCGSNVLKVSRTGIAGYEVLFSDHGSREKASADLIVNATYAGANSILLAGGLAAEVTEYVFHTTEVVVVRAAPGTPALTVMDGPFMSVLPFAGRPGSYLVYDVELSVTASERGIEPRRKCDAASSWDRMRQKGSRFLPFMNGLEYVESLWGLRPVCPDDPTDSRSTRIAAHAEFPGFYSILEGKFVSAPLMARRLVERARRDGWLS